MCVCECCLWHNVGSRERNKHDYYLGANEEEQSCFYLVVCCVCVSDRSSVHHLRLWSTLSCCGYGCCLCLWFTLSFRIRWFSSTWSCHFCARANNSWRWLASLVNGHVNIHYYYFSVATRYFWFFLLSACCVAVRMKSQMKQHNTTIHPYNVWCCCTATTTKYHPISLKCSTAFYYSTLYVYVLNWFHTEASCTNCAKKTVKNHV